MEINRMISAYNFNDGELSRIKYIVIHYVGALGGAEENCKYYAGGSRGASAHYFVGFNGAIWQSVEDCNIAWHCGAKAYEHPECRNANSIGIELCVRKKDTGTLKATDRDWYFEDETVWAAAELTRYLMKKYNVPASHVLRHYDVTGKICPNPYVYNTTDHTWDEFKNLINDTGQGKEESTAQLYRVRKNWEDAKSQIGAFYVLENAKAACKEGYTVYDEAGKAVYENKPQKTESGQTEGAATGSTEEKEIWDFLRGKGLNACAAAGIMGNLYAESGLRANNLQNSFEKKLGMDDTGYTAAVDNGSYTNFVHDGAGYGLAQWTFYSRKQALLGWAKAAGLSIGDLKMQLSFLWMELKGYSAVMERLNGAGNVREASDAVLLEYEKPADQSEEVQEKRAVFGQSFYDMYAERKAEPEVPYKVRVDILDLNIRTGAGTNYAKTGEHTGAGVFTIIEEKAGAGAEKGWGKLKSGAGWISLDYCTKLK